MLWGSCSVWRIQPDTVLFIVIANNLRLSIAISVPNTKPNTICLLRLKVIASANNINKSYTIIHIVLKEIGVKALSIIMLANALAIGAAAPLMFTGAVINAPLADSIFKPSMVLPYHLYILLTQGISTENAYATAFVLLSIVLILNFFAVFLRFLKISKSGIKHE